MTLGQQLRDARLSRNLTVSEVAAATRMKSQYVAALENDDFSCFAAPIYGKGFIRLYAEYVGLDPAPLVDEYMGTQEPPPSPTLQGDAEAPVLTQDEVVEDYEEEPVHSQSEGAFRIRDAAQSADDEDMSDEPLAAPSVGEPPEEDSDPDLFDSVDQPQGDDLDLFSRVQTNRPAGVGTEETSHRAGNRRRAASGADIRDAAQNILKGLIGRCSAMLDQAKTVRPKVDFKNQPLKSASVIGGIVLLVIFLLSGMSRCFRAEDATPGAALVNEERPFEMAVDVPDPYLE